jgi:hypothetical protein
MPAFFTYPYLGLNIGREASIINEILLSLGPRPLILDAVSMLRLLTMSCVALPGSFAGYVLLKLSMPNISGIKQPKWMSAGGISSPENSKTRVDTPKDPL